LKKFRGKKTTTLGLGMHTPAVDVKQNAKPAKQEDATVPSTPANGRERRRPIVSLDDQANSVRSGVCVSVSDSERAALSVRS
jgi:hypothetical protein